MGQGNSSIIQFKDCWAASDVSGDLIECKKTCKFTQYSSKVFTLDRETSIVCKVYESANETIAFGLLPHDQAKGCQNEVLGQRRIYGSIGCHVSPNSVSLMKNGNCFFEGTFETSGVFTITARIAHGKITFYVNDSKVNSSELADMSFNDRYRLGVSMKRQGQKASVFFGCPVTFKDNWSAGDVTREMLTVKKSTNFTFFSEQELQPSGKVVVVANCLRNCRNSVGLGVVPSDCRDMCQSNLPGMQTGSVACLIKSGLIVIAVNGDVVFGSDVNTTDPCVLEMVVDDGKISFKFDGKGLDCEQLESIRVTDAFRIGVGMSAEGQVVEMRGSSENTQSLIGSSEQEKSPALDQLIRGLVDLLAASNSDELRWKDNMKSIDCDSADIIAVGVRKFTATLYTQCSVSATGNSSASIRVLKLNPRDLMMIGVVDEDQDDVHATHHLGAAGFNNSLGLSNRGDLILKGSTSATGRGFKEGDLVLLEFSAGKLSIKVNGVEAVNELGSFSFKSKFRWAVSMTNVGQAVKLGSEPLTSDEVNFCARKGVDVNMHSTAITAVSSLDSDDDVDTPVASPTRASSKLKSTISSSQSNDEAITGCFIDASDLKYGGKPLGAGSFGKVYRGKWDDSDVAIKVMPWDDDDSQRREILVGRSLTQPNIANIIGWSRCEDDLLVVMPLYRKGSLDNKLTDLRKRTVTPNPSAGGPFGFEFVFKISLGLLRAIKYLASRRPNPYVHRDIKPGNVLLDDNDQPMLTDFGTAKSLMSTAATTSVGTPFYFAAEQAKGEGASTATDVHAVALVIYEVLCAPRPCRNSTNILGLMSEISSGKTPPFSDVPSEISTILKPAFAANPRERPTAKDMVVQFESLRAKFTSL